MNRLKYMKEESDEIDLVVYKVTYCGEFSETYKKIFTKHSDAEEFIKILLNDEDVSDVRVFICQEQNIDYLKKK